MSPFGLLLDSGHVMQLGSKIKTLADARRALARHNYLHRIATYCGDIVRPRLAVGLVKPKPKSVAAREIGSIGGKARAASLTPKRRREIAQKAARTRWSKKDRTNA